MQKKHIIIIIAILLLLLGTLGALFFLGFFGKKDATPPATPGGVKASAPSHFEVELAWSHSTDDIAVIGYRVYQGPALLESLGENKSRYGGLKPGSTYCFSVSAVDSSGKESAKSKEVCAETPPLVVAKKVEEKPAGPTPPKNLRANAASPTEVRVAWEPGTAGYGIKEYRIYRDGKIFDSTPKTEYAHTGLLTDTKYCYEVATVDNKDEESKKAGPACATTPTVPDRMPPSVPTGLQARPLSPGEMSVIWNPSKDNVGVAGYHVFEGGKQFTTVSLASTSHLGLQGETEYCYRVSAFDEAGNESEKCPEVCAKTPSIVDNKPPSVPLNVRAIAVSPTQINVSWSESIDNDRVAQYKVYKDAQFLRAVPETKTSYSGENLMGEICFEVTALDPTGNESGPSRRSCVTMKETGVRGTVWTFGENTYGQLGDGTSANKLVAAEIKDLKGVVKVAAGVHHNVALMPDGTIMTWGRNNNGQLGDGTTKDSPVPIPVQNVRDVKDIAAGWSHTVVLKNDGTVWAWGRNYYGQLGDGTSMDRNKPVQVKGLDNVIAIAAGWYHTVAVRSDGTVWSCGWNLKGQLGDGSTKDSKKVVRITDFSGIKKVAAGQYHTLALKEDGSLWAWGWGADGMLGDGTERDWTVPVQVKELGKVRDFAGGGSHSLAITEDGSVWVWGKNNYGQLGNGDIASQRLPIKLEKLSGATSVSAGMEHSVVTLDDGSAWIFGWDLKGKAGKSLTPRKIDIGTAAKAASCGMKHVVVLGN